MSFDLYAALAELQACPKDGQLPEGLASGFVDACTSWSTRGNESTHRNDKNNARRCYMEHVSRNQLKIDIIETLGLAGSFVELPDPNWIAFEIAFTLETPWYSKDDRPFHVLDNPVRKDRVFGVPFMAAASWKGLLRWASRMQAGLQTHLQEHNGSLQEWNDPPWITHLFGNEKKEDEHFQSGALAFRPTWFSKIGFEVINPHSRKTRAGTKPIYYEVVPACTKGQLRLLYAPLPGAADRDKVEPSDALGKLLCATHTLLEAYGISAKRTAGWGTAKITAWKAWGKDTPTAQPIESSSGDGLLKQLFPSPGNTP
jgi:CRISPR-associated protein Cmr2